MAATATLAAAPRSARASFAAMLGISLVFMLIAINTSVVGTAMPRIVADLRGYALYPWAAAAFLMTNAVTIPIAGRLGDLHGRKPFMLGATVLFAAASAACGLAGSMLQLVLARGLQGVAGGVIVGVVAACVTDLFPDRRERVRWQVMLSSAFGIAQAVGPWLGGWLTERIGWRAVFFVNLPVALLALPVVWRYLPLIVHHEGDERSIDWASAGALALTVMALMLGAEATQAWGVGDARTLAAGAAVALFGAAFLRRQYRTPAPIVPPAVLDDAGARLLMVLGILTGLTMFMLIFYTPLLLQGALGQSPREAGVVMTPLLMCITVGSIVNGRILPRLHHAERLVVWGQLGLLAGCLLLTRLDAAMPRPAVMAIFALCGVSLGFQLPNFTLQIMTLAGQRNAGVASALVQSTRMLGSMVGVGLASVLVNGVYGRRIEAALAPLNAADPALRALLASPQILVREADRQQMLERALALGLDPAPLLAAARDGLTAGTHAAFMACAVIAALCALVSLRLPRFDVRGG